MNRRGFLKKLGLAAGATATVLVVPDWLAEIPKGRSMVAVPELGMVKWVTAFDDRVSHIYNGGDKSFGGFLVPEGFKIELLRDYGDVEMRRLEEMIRRDIAETMAARVEADFLNGARPEFLFNGAKPKDLTFREQTVIRTRLAEKYNRQRLEEFAEKMKDFTVASEKASISTYELKVEFEKLGTLVKDVTA